MSDESGPSKQPMNEILASIRAIIGEGGGEDGKLDKQTTASIAEALAAQEEELSAAQPPLRPSQPPKMGALTVEDLAAELMRPMLQRWIDEHLHSIVKELVAGEVKRKMRR